MSVSLPPSLPTTKLYCEAPLLYLDLRICAPKASLTSIYRSAPLINILTNAVNVIKRKEENAWLDNFAANKRIGWRPRLSEGVGRDFRKCNM